MKPKRIQFSVKTKCQFNCEFCMYDGTTEYFDIDTFFRYAEMFYEFGVREFELTPVTGDSMLDHQLTWKIDYLNSLGAEKIIVFTNGYALTANYVDILQSYTQVELNVSIYGGNQSEFKKRTGVDGFERVLDTLYGIIGHKNLNPNSVVFHKRYSDNESAKLRMALEIAKTRGIQIWDCSHDTDWHEMVESNCHLGSTEKGICRFALEDNAVLPDGDVTLCGWFDVDKKMIIGNVNEQSLDEIYSEGSKFNKIITEQRNGVYRGLCCTCTMRYDKRN